jgi:hypothetical protein
VSFFFIFFSFLFLFLFSSLIIRLTCHGSLVANIIAGEVVEPIRRTAVFGMLQGCFMLGQGIGYLSKPLIHPPYLPHSPC